MRLNAHKLAGTSVAEAKGEPLATLRHVTEAALAGAQVATIPTKVFDQMIAHPLTDKGIEGFMADWKKSGR